MTYGEPLDSTVPMMKDAAATIIRATGEDGKYFIIVMLTATFYCFAVKMQYDGNCGVLIMIISCFWWKEV
jgi:hypothetical protein